jgi:hypothetical protein
LMPFKNSLISRCKHAGLIAEDAETPIGPSF